VPPVESAPTQTEDGAATVMMTREQLQQTVADGLSGSKKVTVLDTTGTDQGLALTPTISIEGAHRTGLQTYQVIPPDASQAVSVQVPEGSSASEAIGWMMGSAAPLPVDMSGRISGWYRLTQDGKSISADTAMSAIDARQPLVLEFVVAETWSAQIEVVQGDSTVRFMSPVSSCVPVASLVTHLQSWLGLSAGVWRLYRDGKRLGSHTVLAEGGPTPSLTLVLRQDGE